MASTDNYTYRNGVRGNHVQPTRYHGSHAQASSTSNTANATGGNSIYFHTRDQGVLSANAALKIRDRLSSSVRGAAKAALAVSAVEWKTSVSMIAGRSMQIVQAYRHLRAGRPMAMLKTLGAPNKIIDRKGTKYLDKWTPKKARQQPSAAWLEAHFGWAPLYGDIYQACQVMGSSPAHQPVKVSFADRSVSWSRSTAKDYRPGSGPWGIRYDYLIENLQYDVRVKSGCKAYASNPNLALLSGLGLVNPAHVAWDLVPFSFVVDWFIPVGAYLKTFDAFLGFTVEDGWTTIRVKGNMTYDEGYQYRTDAPWSNNNVTSVTRVYRQDSIPSIPYPWELRPNFKPNLWQAITSVALVQTVLGGRSK